MLITWAIALYLQKICIRARWIFKKSTIENKNQNDDMKHLSFLSPHGKFAQSSAHYYINLYLLFPASFLPDTIQPV